jgi:hypothetical protein
MNKLLMAAGATLASVSLFATTPALATSNHDHKIGICHATGSKTNPYVYINVDKHAAEAHKKHQDGRDIVGVKSEKDCPKVTKSPSPTPTPQKSASPSPSPQVLGTSTEQPTTLPKTGAGLSMLVGLPAMGFAARTYLRSRSEK